MDFYLLMMYVSLEQELAIRELFVCKGWHFSKKEDSDGKIDWKCGDQYKTWTTPKKLVPETAELKSSSNTDELPEDDLDKTSPHPEIFSDLQDFVEATLNAASANDELASDNKAAVKVCESNVESNNHDGIDCTNNSDEDDVDETLVDTDEGGVDDTVDVNVAELHDSDKKSNLGNPTEIVLDDQQGYMNDKLDESSSHLSCIEIDYVDEWKGSSERNLRNRKVSKQLKMKLNEPIETEMDTSENQIEPPTCHQGNKSSSINSSKILVANSRKHVTKLKRKAIKCRSTLSRDQSKLIVQKASKVGTFYCGDCKNTYHLLGAYKKHKRNGKCKFECEYCGKLFTSRYYANYKCHLKNHAKDRPHICSVCQKSYSDIHTLNVHLRKHSGVRPYMCQHCGRQFYSSSHLLSHETSMHSKPPEKYQCNICSARLSTLGNLRVHQNVVHAEERPFTCEICGKSFKTRKTLEQVHAKVHLNVYPFVCDYSGCGKKFKRSGSYTEHVRRHNNQRSHFCKNCGKGFYTKKDMLLHTRIHTGEKPYKCEVCEYKSALLGNLQKHVKTHVT